jgi:tetratricopeptide (TPR) repeat protein
VRGLPGRWSITEDLERRLKSALQGLDADERITSARSLHSLAERTRDLYGAEDLAGPAREELAASCRDFWYERHRIVQQFGPVLAPAIREDLLDVAIFWANLQERLAASLAQTHDARGQALTVLTEAEQLFGPNPVIAEEKRLHGSTETPLTGESAESATPWPHYALARALLRSGKLESAAQESIRAVSIDPQGFWPNFYHGQCAYKQARYADAAAAFGVCIGGKPNAAGCFLNRALAFSALGLTDPAIRDYNAALRLNPTLAVTAAHRAAILCTTPVPNRDRKTSNSAPASGSDPR